jgi:glycosyltransferase involved in cell wall biosynthesis
MRIGVDARELGGRATGVGRYLAGLLREWSGMPAAAAHDFVLYAPEPPGTTLDSRRFRHRAIAGPPGTWWEQVKLPRVAAHDHLDVFFAPAYTAPLGLDVPTVLTIHDLSYVAHPEWFRVREGIRRRWLTRQSASRARAIITVSAFSRGEIVEQFGEAGDRVRVIPQGIDLPGATSPRSDSAPRVLYAGSLFNRRHVPDLIRAIEVLARRRPDVSLDIVGDDRTFPREDVARTIVDLGVGGRVRWHRYVSNEELTELYGRARAFAFLSEYEGLGMTPLEALGSGIPPVLYDTPVARETCGGAALYVPLGDIPGVAAALERALFDEATRGAILTAAPAALAKYDWPRAARETLAVLEDAAKSG